jgi:hypothetical protein
MEGLLSLIAEEASVYLLDVQGSRLLPFHVVKSIRHEETLQF